MPKKTEDLALQQRRTVQAFPDEQGGLHYIISLATFADGFPRWGQNWLERDLRLRDFYKEEPWLGSTVGSLAARNAAFSWTLEGPPRTVAVLQEMLQAADFGKGWMALISKLSVDLYTQDNGAFIEIIRAGDTETSPVVGIAHLDSARCQRTGNPDFPVIYTNRENEQHKMPWWSVCDFTDNPSPDEMKNGLQVCGVSRILRYAQVLRDIAVRKQEKLEGRFAGALHVVSGLSTAQLNSALMTASEFSDEKARRRYQPPVVIGTVDPTAKVDKTTIELASLPENWSQDEEMKWYIACLALAFGCEYQDLAPLPGGGLGSSQQSTVLHLKARGKGPELFQKLIEHRLNFFVLPKNVTFKYSERDFQTDGVQADVEQKRASVYKTYVDMGMPTQVVWQIMQDSGAISPEIFELLKAAEAEDVTPDRTAEDLGPYQETPEGIRPVPPVLPPAAPPKPGATLAAVQAEETVSDDQAAKALAATDYWGVERTRLEQAYYEEVAAMFQQASDDIADRLTEFEETELEGAS